MDNSSGGALCYQQIASCQGTESDQHRESHSAHEVGVFNLHVRHGGADGA